MTEMESVVEEAKPNFFAALFIFFPGGSRRLSTGSMRQPRCLVASRSGNSFRIDPSARGNEGLRAELVDMPGSTGHAQPVGGK